MRRSNLPGAAACLGAALLSFACRDPGKERTTTADAGHDHIVTQRDLEERLASQPPQIRAQYATPEARKKLLDDMIRLELLAQEARRRGFDRSPRIKVLVSELLVEEMMNSLFGSEETEASKITDDEIRRYYDAHSAEFSAPKEGAGVARSVADVQTLVRSRLAQEKRREAIATFTDDVVARGHVQLRRPDGKLPE